MKILGLRGFAVMLLLACAVVLMPGCKSNKEPEPLPPTFDDGSDAGFEETNSDGLPNINLDDIAGWKPASNLETVYFDYDSSSLRPDALNALRRNADTMRQNPGTVYQIAGHCDERGTQEYNLALGERRALIVREHLITLGVSGDRIITISYGEELPAQLGSGESVWAKNRRAEFNEAQWR